MEVHFIRTKLAGHPSIFDHPITKQWKTIRLFPRGCHFRFFFRLFCRASEVAFNRTKLIPHAHLYLPLLRLYLTGEARHEKTRANLPPFARTLFLFPVQTLLYFTKPFFAASDCYKNGHSLPKRRVTAGLEAELDVEAERGRSVGFRTDKRYVVITRGGD